MFTRLNPQFFLWQTIKNTDIKLIFLVLEPLNQPVYVSVSLFICQSVAALSLLFVFPLPALRQDTGTAVTSSKWSYFSRIYQKRPFYQNQLVKNQKFVNLKSKLMNELCEIRPAEEECCVVKHVVVLCLVVKWKNLSLFISEFVFIKSCFHIRKTTKATIWTIYLLLFFTEKMGRHRAWRRLQR